MANGKFVKNGIGHHACEIYPFAELFSVRIKHKNALEKFQVYGNIYVEDDKGSLCIFNQHDDDGRSNLIDGSLPLTFNRSICARSNFTLSFDLKDEDGNTIKGKFVAKLVMGKYGNFKKLGVDRIFGSMGCATIYYTFNQAANIYTLGDAILMKHNIDSDKFEDASWVCGTIVFQYGKPFDSRSPTQDIEKNCHEIVLFNSTKHMPLMVDETGSCYKFPLLRSQLVMPFSYYLIFKFNLDYYDKGKVKHIQFNQVLPSYKSDSRMTISKEEGDDMLFKLMLRINW